MNRLELINQRIEKEKLRNTRDFKEVALAISLLLALSAFLSKTIAYFNSNVISLNGNFQSIVYMGLFLLILEFILIFIFLLLKGYLIAIRDLGNNESSAVTSIIFKNIFIFPLCLFTFSLIVLLSRSISDMIGGDSSSIPFSILIFSITVGAVAMLIQLNMGGAKRRSQFIFIVLLSVFIFALFYMKLYLLPSYLLIGSFSIDVFPQSSADNSTLTFEITETGMQYSKNYVSLYDVGTPDIPLFDMVDFIILKDGDRTASDKRFMWGIKHGGVYYITIYNKSDLPSGNYVLHAEVTDDFSKNSTFGENRKHADKIFSIE